MAVCKKRFISIAVILSMTLLLPYSLGAGIIKGKVKVKKNIPRRVAQRYPGKHSQTPAVLEPIPAVAVVLGPVNGFPPPPPAKTQEIVQKKLKFRPSLLVIPVNSEVAFPNQDPEFHNVFSYSKAKRFDLGRYHKGESKSVRFTQPGIVKVYCEIHQWMRAAVVVVENPFYATADDAGNFRINNVPAGTYQLLIWKMDHKAVTTEINVPASGSVQLTVTLPEEKSKRPKKNPGDSQRTRQKDTGAGTAPLPGLKINKPLMPECPVGSMCQGRGEVPSPVTIRSFKTKISNCRTTS